MGSHDHDGKVWLTAEFANRLIDEFGYTPAEVASTIMSIEDEALPETRDAICDWWGSGLLEEPSVGVYSPAWFLATGRKRDPVEAFLAMDWLLRDPEAALASFEQAV